MLFPALAGVILGKFRICQRCITFPRTRGGDPVVCVSDRRIHRFSPHSRG